MTPNPSMEQAMSAGCGAAARELVKDIYDEFGFGTGSTDFGFHTAIGQDNVSIEFTRTGYCSLAGSKT